MQKFFEHSLIIDLSVFIVFWALICYFDDSLSSLITLPKENTVNNFLIALITVLSAFSGFLLTIIILVITFKNNFKSQKPKERKSVFEKIPAENTFFLTNIYDNFVKVMMNTIIEMIGFLFLLLFVQFNILNLSLKQLSIISFLIFIVTGIALFRSLVLFKMFQKISIN